MLHFNDKSRRSVRFPLAASPAPLAGEDTALPPADLMTSYVVLAVDASGSIRPYTRAVYQSLQAALETMAKANAEAIDMVYKVKLITFNTEVKEFHPDFLAPEALLELLSEKDYQPGGGTHISKLYGALDEQGAAQGRPPACCHHDLRHDRHGSPGHCFRRGASPLQPLL